MFDQESFAFDFVGFMLGFLFQSAGSRCQFVLFFAALATSPERHLADRRQIVDNFAQLIQFFANGRQFFGICGQIVAITFSRFATGKKIDLIFDLPLQAY